MKECNTEKQRQSLDGLTHFPVINNSVLNHLKNQKKKKNGIHSMQGLTATTRHAVKRKRSTKRLKDTGNLFRKKSI